MFYRYQWNLKAKFLLVTAGILAKKVWQVLIFRWIKALILIPKSQDRSASLINHRSHSYRFFYDLCA